MPPAREAGSKKSHSPDSPSQLHAVACSASGVQVIREFGQHWAKEKPNETGSNFSLSTDFAFQVWLKKRDEVE